jgi:hypothetical protein
LPGRLLNLGCAALPASLSKQPPAGAHVCRGTYFRSILSYGDISVSARGLRFAIVIALSIDPIGLEVCGCWFEYCSRHGSLNARFSQQCQELHALTALLPGKVVPVSLDRRLGGPQIRSGRLGEDKILDPTGTRTSDCSVVQPVASRYTDCAIPAP